MSLVNIMRGYHPFRRIRNRILAAFAAVTLVPLLLLGYYISLEAGAHVRSMRIDELAAQSLELDRQIGEFVKNMNEDVEYLATNQLLRSVDASVTSYMDKTGDAQGLVRQTPLHNGGLEAEIFTCFEIFRATHPQVEYMSFAVEENGGYVQSPATTRKAGYDPRVRPWYRLAVENGGAVAMTEPYATSNAEALEISFVRAVYDDAGRLKGVLSVDVTLRGLAERFKNANSGKNGFIVLADSRGTVIVDTGNSAMAMKNIREYGVERLSEPAAINSGTFSATIGGRPATVMISASSATGWKIIAFSDDSDVMAAAGNARQKIVFFAVGIFVMVLVLGFFFAQAIDNPIHQVVAAAKAIAAGDLTAPRRLNLGGGGKDEMGVLGNSIADMADKIAHSFKEIEENTKRQVAAKTLQRQNEYLALLHETVLSLINQLDLDTVLNMIVTGAARLVGTSHGFIYLLDKQKGVFVLSQGVGAHAQHVGFEASLDQGLIGTVYKTGEPLLVNDYSSWLERMNNVRIFDELQAVLEVPLKSGHQVVGAIGLSLFEQGKTFSKEEIGLLMQFAEIASIALENARLHTVLQKELSDRQKAEAALMKSEVNNKALISAIPDNIFRFDQAGIMLDLRPGKERLPWIAYEATGRLLADAIPARLAEQMLGHASLAAEFGDIQSFEYDYEDDGVTEWEIRIVSIGHGEFLAIVRDVTERKAMQRRMEYMSMHDALTGLYNRNRFEQEMQRLDSGGGHVGVIICDVDGLKFINDSLGHEVGDVLLTITGKLLRRVFGKNDILARVGGDEFAVLMPGAAADYVEQVSRNLRAAIEEYNHNNSGLLLSVSIGSACSSEDNASINLLYKEADDHMYREKLHRKTSVHNSIAQALMNTLEAREYASPEKTRRIQSIAAGLAERLGFGEQAVANIRLLAKYHDIGTVGIPGAILAKAGPLTGKERQEVYRHSEVGYRLAQSIPELLPIAEWIFKHHEWWNGEGYPLGLKREDIPLECRITAIADAYDAMTSDRPYRSALTKEQALAELARNSGLQFDPRLVSEFLAMMKEEADDNV